MSVSVSVSVAYLNGLRGFFCLLRKREKIINRPYHRIIMTWGEREIERGSTCREVDYSLRGKLAPAAGGCLFHFYERNDSDSLVESVN